MQFKIRNILPNDYNNVCDLGTKSYPDNYYEGEESFISKIKGCYEGCLVADLDGVIGYIISFPYFIGKPYPIDHFYETPEGANCWYIHDLCVSIDFRGKGIAKDLVKIILKRKEIFCLTAVLNSENFWNKMGFRSFFEIDYYGAKAKYMMLIS